MTGNLSSINTSLQRPSKFPEGMVMSLDYSKIVLPWLWWCIPQWTLQMWTLPLGRQWKEHSDDIRAEALGFISSFWTEFIRPLSCATTAPEGVLQIITKLTLLHSKGVTAYQYSESEHSVWIKVWVRGGISIYKHHNVPQFGKQESLIWACSSSVIS